MVSLMNTWYQILGITLIISLYNTALSAIFLTPVLKMYLQFSKEAETYLSLILGTLVLLQLINKLLFRNITATSSP